jgi:hypothetical protein
MSKQQTQLVDTKRRLSTLAELVKERKRERAEVEAVSYGDGEVYIGWRNLG